MKPLPAAIMSTRIWIAVSAAIALFLVPLRAEERAGARAAAPDGAAVLEEAERTYAQALETRERDARIALFDRAAALYRKVAESRIENADLYTNLGNAALQAERLGDAILAYKTALAYDPDHPRARQNLMHARTLMPLWVPAPRAGSVLDSFFFRHMTLARAERAMYAAVAFFAAALLFAAALRWRRATPRNLAWIPTIIWGGLLASIIFAPRAGDGAAVVIADTQAYAADSANAPAVFPEPLPAGAEVTVLEKRGGWARVRLADGARDTWIALPSIAFVPAS